MVITTGFFDGVHLGHRYVIDSLVKAAKERGTESCVVTFWPHPRTVLQDGARELRLLSSFQEKKDILLGLGVDRVEVVDFNREFSRLTAEEYLRDYVKDRFNGEAILLGYDNRMGSDCLSHEKIVKTAESLSLEVIQVERFGAGSWTRPVSSTLIRMALGTGDVVNAAEMLGRRYSIVGEVVPGNQVGRTIGFPTANIRIQDTMKLVPLEGAYFVEVLIGNETYFGMCNVAARIEVHIFDFDGQIYGKELKISFVRRIRNEIEINSLSLLKEQLEKDEALCRQWISLI